MNKTFLQTVAPHVMGWAGPLLELDSGATECRTRFPVGLDYPCRDGGKVTIQPVDNGGYSVTRFEPDCAFSADTRQCRDAREAIDELHDFQAMDLTGDNSENSENWS